MVQILIEISMSLTYEIRNQNRWTCSPNIERSRRVPVPRVNPKIGPHAEHHLQSGAKTLGMWARGVTPPELGACWLSSRVGRRPTSLTSSRQRSTLHQWKLLGGKESRSPLGCSDAVSSRLACFLSPRTFTRLTLGTPWVNPSNLQTNLPRNGAQHSDTDIQYVFNRVLSAFGTQDPISDRQLIAKQMASWFVNWSSSVPTAGHEPGLCDGTSHAHRPCVFLCHSRPRGNFPVVLWHASVTRVPLLGRSPLVLM